MRQSSLESLAPELLCRIATHLVLDGSSYIGPPSAVLPFVSTSRSIHRAVSLTTNAQFLSYVFAFKFDHAAPLRRLGPKRVNAVSYASELHKRFKAMSRIRKGTIVQERLHEDLWTMLLMLLENDGRNERQLLEWAHLPAFIIKYLRLLDASGDQSGLNRTFRTPTFSLALWTLYLLTRLGAFTNECPEDAVFLKNFLRPIVVSAYQFPSVHASEKFFNVAQTPQSNHLETGLNNACYPALARLTPTTSTIVHFAAPLAISEPPLNSAAFLSLITRLDSTIANETRRPSISQQENVTSTATVPSASRSEGTTDHVHPNRLQASQPVSQPPAILPPVRQWVGSAEDNDSRHFDVFWQRLTSCTETSQPLIKTVMNSSKYSRDGNLSTTFTPGKICGCWSGKLMIPDYQAYHDLITDSPSASASRVALYQQPMKLFLREHHSTSLGPTAQPGDRTVEPDSYQNAWFPENTTFAEDKCRGNLTITHSRTPKRAHYVTYCQREHGLLSNVSGVQHYARRLGKKDADGVASANSHRVADIVLTGETDENSGEQYGHYTFFGRVRPWDGLVVLVRKPMYSDHISLGKWVFMGYLVSTGLIVGRWRDTCTSPSQPPYEGPFVLTLQDAC